MVRTWNINFWIWNPTCLLLSYTFLVSMCIFMVYILGEERIMIEWLLCDYLQAFPLIHHSRSEVVKRKKSWILCKELFHGFSSWWTTCFQEHAMRSFSQGKASLSNLKWFNLFLVVPRWYKMHYWPSVKASWLDIGHISSSFLVFLWSCCNCTKWLCVLVFLFWNAFFVKFSVLIG